MLKMHLRQPGLTYSDCGLKTNNKKIKEAGDSRYFYQNEPDKGCFQHDMTYGDFKHLPRKTAADKVLPDKAFNVAKNPNFYGCQRILASMVYSKCPWVVLLKDGKSITITKAFQEILHESRCKPNIKYK